ncbi:MAG TPA: FtsK/SpoIIIE domain-containing protein [Thermoanaerobaculia bacterium]|nr:FtsK/SpoIIIE domain-containing protein [Thermoanaerobaculia bacterium]
MRTLNVTEIRNNVYWAAGGPQSAGSGERALPLLGMLFHQTFAGLTGSDERVNLVRPLERADATQESWRRELASHAYAWHVAPRLEEHQAELQGEATAVASYWEAVRNLTGWLADLVWEQRASGRSIAEAREFVFAGSEHEVNQELRDDAWSAPVLVNGRIDALLRQPDTGALCALELKSGRTAPEADVCQAAMYRMLLGTDDVALLSFKPEPHEQRFASDQLADAQLKLKALIGRLAGVIDDASSEEQATLTVPPHAQTHAETQARPSAMTGQKIVAALREGGVRVKLGGEPLTGPAFVRYYVDTEPGVRPDRIPQLATTLWTRLRTNEEPQISIERGRIVIDVERPDRQTVYWRDLRGELQKPSRAGSSRFPVGVAIDGSLHWADFAKPQDSHMLVAGTAGSGKSEWLRAAIASLLAQNTPDTLKLLLIDPKRTAFHAFEQSQSLYAPVVYPDDTPIAPIFTELIEEMERRYRVISDAGLPDLGAYNLKHEPLPRIVCFCDEYADLIMADPKQRKEIERLVGRLSAKGRAAGVHLVFATQRPSREVVTGVIDTNLMARVCLRVVKPAESRIVLGGDNGASSLLGRGDLLFKDLGAPIRLQSPYVEDNELAALL